MTTSAPAEMLDFGTDTVTIRAALDRKKGYGFRSVEEFVAHVKNLGNAAREIGLAAHPGGAYSPTRITVPILEGANTIGYLCAVEARTAVARILLGFVGLGLVGKNVPVVYPSDEVRRQLALCWRRGYEIKSAVPIIQNGRTMMVHFLLARPAVPVGLDESDFDTVPATS